MWTTVNYDIHIVVTMDLSVGRDVTEVSDG